MEKGLKECIQNCIECSRMSMAAAMYLLDSKNKETDHIAIRLLLDCAEMCQVNANLMIRESTFYQMTCGISADICEACAKECGKHGDDDLLTSCAAMCRLCAESCEQMTTFAIHQV